METISFYAQHFAGAAVRRDVLAINIGLCLKATTTQANLPCLLRPPHILKMECAQKVLGNISAVNKSEHQYQTNPLARSQSKIRHMVEDVKKKKPLKSGALGIVSKSILWFQNILSVVKMYCLKPNVSITCG